MEGARKRRASAFDELKGEILPRNLSCLALAIWDGELSLACARFEFEPLCFVDNNRALWGQHLEGLPVFSPEEGARLYGSCAVFVVTIWYGEASEGMASRVAQLRELSCTSVVSFVPLYWKFASVLLPRYMLDCPHKIHEQADRVRQGFHLMEDDGSRREYLAQLRFRLLADFDSVSVAVQGRHLLPRRHALSLGRGRDFRRLWRILDGTPTLFLIELRIRSNA